MEEHDKMREYKGIEVTEFDVGWTGQFIQPPLSTLKPSRLIGCRYYYEVERKKAKELMEGDQQQAKALIMEYLGHMVEIFNKDARVPIPEEIGKAIKLIEGKLRRIFKCVHVDKVPSLWVGYQEYEQNAEGVLSCLIINVEYSKAEEYNFEIVTHIFENGFIRVGYINYLFK